MKKEKGKKINTIFRLTKKKKKKNVRAPFFALRIMGQPRRKLCLLNFHWKTCDFKQWRTLGSWRPWQEVKLVPLFLTFFPISFFKLWT